MNFPDNTFLADSFYASRLPAGASTEKEAEPRFELTPIVHELQQQIVSADCQGDVIALLGVGGRLVVRDMMQDGPPLTGSVRNPHRVFMDPSGGHTLVSTADGEMHYFSVYYRKATGHFILQNRGASDAAGGRNNVATCVCWLPESVENSLSPTKNTSEVERGVSGWGTKVVPKSLNCLVGSKTDGILFLVRVDVSPEGSGVKLSCRRSLQLPGIDQQWPVGSIQVERVGSLWVLFVSTPVSIYRAESVADSPLDLFNSLTSCPEAWVIRSVPAVKNSLSAGSVTLYKPGCDAPAHSYAWASCAGVVHGLMNVCLDEYSNTGEAALFESSDECAVVNEQFLDLTQAIPSEDVSVDPTAYAARRLERPPTSGSFELPPVSTLISVELTAFHMLLLYKDRFVVLNHPAGLSWRSPSSTLQCDHPHLQEIEERVRYDPFRFLSNKEDFRGIIRDTAARKVYIFGGNILWELHVEQEHRRQWRIFVDRALNTHESALLRNRFFRAAYMLCKYDEVARNTVQLLRGKFFLHIGAIHRAMDVLAECDCFEDVYHLLISLRNSKALQLYVEKRYNYLIKQRASEKDSEVQLACLLTLIIVQRLDIIARSEYNAGVSTDSAVTESLLSGLTAFIQESITKRLPMFENAGYVNLIAQLLEEQFRPEIALSFADKMNKLRYIVTYHVSHANYVQAATILGAHARRLELRESWYEFAPLLMKKCPVQFTKSMLCAVAHDAYDMPYMLLKVERLIPTFSQYVPQMNEDPSVREHQVVLFLGKCVSELGCDLPVVHNYYLSLLVAHAPERLNEFLQSSPFYDPGFALRRCLETHMYPECVELYQRLGLYEDALRMAIRCGESERCGTAPGAAGSSLLDGSNGTMASRSQFTANIRDNDGEGEEEEDVEKNTWFVLERARGVLMSLPEDLPPNRRKRLWLILAHHAVEKHNNQIALNILTDSCGVLRLEDILVKMNSDKVVGNFKEAICKSLEVYTTSTKSLREQQLETGRISEELKREIAQLRNRFVHITSHQRCMLCHQMLLHGENPFFIYPSCRHAVHESCAVARLQGVGGLEAFVADEGLPKHFVENVKSIRDLAQAECVMCGEAVILEIDMPLFVEDPSWSISS